MPTPPSDPIANQLQALRTSLDSLTQRIDELATDNRKLHAELAESHAARTDLVAQAEHLLHQLTLSRNEVRELKGQSNLPS